MMQFYEAAPGHFLPVGVSMAEHTAAMADNYNPFMDDLLWDEEEQYLSDLERDALTRRRMEALRERDARRVWRTIDGEDVALSRLGKRHLINICGFLLGMGFDPKDVTPNLAAVAESRWAPTTKSRQRGR